MNASYRRATLAMTVIALTTTACAGAPTTRQDPFGGPTSGEEVILTVHNHDTRNATIYAQSLRTPSSRVRLALNASRPSTTN
jgi:hypothetical protein